MPTVLCVEDNALTAKLVQSTISSLCELTIAGTIKEAMAKLETLNVDLFILDVELPDGNGFEFCQKLRESSRWANTPIIFLTALSEVEQRVQGFALGADDYITKPLEPREFKARVASKLKRSSPAMETFFEKANFGIDLKLQKIFRSPSSGDREDLNLTPTEFKLMMHFLQNQGVTLSRQDLVGQVWGSAVHVSDHTVDAHISTLRKKIGPSAQYLKAVIKKGYCFSIED